MKTNNTKPFLSLILAFSLLFLALTGCGNEAYRYICIIDLSKSIDPEAQADAFNALEQIINKLKRGDSLIVIPLMGDAQTETQGRILRFELSRERKAFDEDKRQLFEEAKAKLLAMREEAKTKPAKKTDLLGAFRIVSEEMFTKDESGTKVHNVVIVLSDLLQDDVQISFTKDARLADEIKAETFAQETARASKTRLKDAPVYLGLLRSTDLARLSPQRRAAVQVFWQIYLQNLNASNVRIAIDGPGSLAQLLQQIR